MTPTQTSGSTKNPVSDLSDEEITALAIEIHRRCRNQLYRYRGIDPEDVAQTAMVTILRWDFGSKFDPQRGSVYDYALAVGWWTCLSAIRGFYAKRRREEPMNALLEEECASAAADPQRTALEVELRDLIEGATLTNADRDALKRIVSRAEGTGGVTGGNSTLRVQETRCRERLRLLLQDYLA